MLANIPIPGISHVLDHLFKPALEMTGYEVIPPTVVGSELIHAEIVRNLEEADLVLCDLSSLNANVFFELGIRTSLDRSVALVKDDQTTSIPFDVNAINVLTYDASLMPWMLTAEIDRLATHVRKAVPAGSGKGNAMWRYFGLTRRAAPSEGSSNPIEAKLDLLLEELRSPQNSLSSHNLSAQLTSKAMRTLTFEQEIVPRYTNFVASLMMSNGLGGIYSLRLDTNREVAFVRLQHPIPVALQNEMASAAELLVLDLRLTHPPWGQRDALVGARRYEVRWSRDCAGGLGARMGSHHVQSGACRLLTSKGLKRCEAIAAMRTTSSSDCGQAPRHAVVDTSGYVPRETLARVPVAWTRDSHTHHEPSGSCFSQHSQAAPEAASNARSMICLVVGRSHSLDQDAVLGARISSVAARHARAGDPLTPGQEEEAIAELRLLAGDRPDLLARCAGLSLGFADYHTWDNRNHLMADLCIKAGADVSVIDDWITVGRARARQASFRPYTGTMRRRSSQDRP